MNIATLRDILLYCTVINLGILAFGGLFSLLLHDWLYSLVGRLFRVSAEQFGALQYTWIVLYKVAILLFNLVPYLALRIVA